MAEYEKFNQKPRNLLLDILVQGLELQNFPRNKKLPNKIINLLRGAERVMAAIENRVAFT